MKHYKKLLVLAGFLLGSLHAYGLDLSTTLGSGSGDSNGDTKSAPHFNLIASFQSKSSMLNPHSLRVIIRPSVNLPGVKSYSDVLNDGDFFAITKLPVNIGVYDVIFYVLKSDGRVLAYKKVRISLASEGSFKLKWKVTTLSGNLFRNGYQSVIDVSNLEQWKLRVQPR